MTKSPLNHDVTAVKDGSCRGAQPHPNRYYPKATLLPYSPKVKKGGASGAQALEGDPAPARKRFADLGHVRLLDLGCARNPKKWGFS